MKLGRTASAQTAAAGFTLIEILLAAMAFAVLLAALNTVFVSGLRLRREAAARLKEVQRRHMAQQILETDLRSAIVTGGILGVSPTLETQRAGYGVSDRLELIAASGTVVEDQPWGELQRISYYLLSPDEAARYGFQPPDTNALSGYVLVRGVQRNLLAPVEEEPEPRPLIWNVDQFDVSFYDGEQWVEDWASTSEEETPEPPLLTRVRIDFTQNLNEDWARRPLEIVEPWGGKPFVKQTAETDASGADQPNPPEGGQEGQAPPGGQQPPSGGPGGGKP
ncbi:MAG: prepilin-type N-terminal cleavage/methylation domain-containing protein [Verrucomicrobia bacterium]|nr:prepilin-type N-terminal cleavage/methylation domain-containing protein [Verrucomicrobiota bacterium]